MQRTAVAKQCCVAVQKTVVEDCHTANHADSATITCRRVSKEGGVAHLDSTVGQHQCAPTRGGAAAFEAARDHRQAPAVDAQPIPHSDAVQ